jgi:hypothetical protein
MPEIRVNRAPFLTLWATIVAEHVGFEKDEALTIGKAVAGLTAQAKGRTLGIFHERPTEEIEKVRELREGMDAKNVPFMGRMIPCVMSEEGVRALTGTRPVDPASVQRYLASKFGEHLDAVRERLEALAATFVEGDELLRQGMDVYVRLRPNVPKGKEGWGKQGLLDTAAIERMIEDRTSQVR